MVERAVGVEQNLLSLAFNVLEVRYQLLQAAGRQGEQQAVARPR
jgi:hypothetical protein